jgi:hypothetical protein
MNPNKKKNQTISVEDQILDYNPILYEETSIPISLGIRPLNLPINTNSNSNTILDYCCLICCCI